MRQKKWNDESFKKAVKDSFSIAEVLRKLGLRPRGGNYKTVHIYIKKLGLNIDHFTGQGWNIDNKFGLTNSRPLEEILVINSPYRSTWSLKRRLLKHGLLGNICSVCKINEWNGKMLTLHLDHINGINNDNRLSNLRLLCPNCHSQTVTYCGKNIGATTPTVEG